MSKSKIFFPNFFFCFVDDSPTRGEISAMGFNQLINYSISSTKIDNFIVFGRLIIRVFFTKIRYSIIFTTISNT